MNRPRKRLTDLLDFFRDYSGKGGQYLRVKADETGIEAEVLVTIPRVAEYHDGTDVPTGDYYTLIKYTSGEFEWVKL